MFWMSSSTSHCLLSCRNHWAYPYVSPPLIRIWLQLERLPSRIDLEWTRSHFINGMYGGWKSSSSFNPYFRWISNRRTGVNYFLKWGRYHKILHLKTRLYYNQLPFAVTNRIASFFYSWGHLSFLVCILKVIDIVLSDEFSMLDDIWRL